MLDLCPCNSDLEYSKCCYLLHDNLKSSNTAVELMKSRYVAYTKQNIDYIKLTSHPKVRKSFDYIHLRNWSEKSKWIDLEIINTINGEESDDLGFVEFKATYLEKSLQVVHHELSFFKKEKNTWYYYQGFDPKLKNDFSALKLPRNIICPCGSKKKFKKCCL